MWGGEGEVMFKYKPNLPTDDCAVTVLKIRAVHAATMWCTSSNVPHLTFTRILIGGGFVGSLLFF
jgi:hypothetical protein